MDEGSKFPIGNLETPEKVRRQVAALFRRDAIYGGDVQGIPSASVKLEPAHRCGSKQGVQQRTGVYCQRCGRMLDGAPAVTVTSLR